MTLMTPLPASDLTPSNAAHCCRVLMRAMDVAAELTEMALEGARAGEIGVAAAAELANALARSMRRSALLVERLEQPRPVRREEADGRQAARQVIRGVEDAIHRVWFGEEADALEQELHERVETPEFLAELEARPAVELVEEICRDLGLDDPHDMHRWKRRTPEAVLALHARARLAVGGAAGDGPGLDRSGLGASGLGASGAGSSGAGSSSLGFSGAGSSSLGWSPDWRDGRAAALGEAGRRPP